jgi:hypothetical protein
MTRKVTITKTWGELAIMRANDIKIFWTPGATAPYASSQQSFADDVCVANYMDFVRAEGFDALSEEEDGLLYSLEIEYPFGEENKQRKTMFATKVSYLQGNVYYVYDENPPVSDADLIAIVNDGEITWQNSGSEPYRGASEDVRRAVEQAA